MKFYEDENYNNTNKKPTNLQGGGGGGRMEMMKVGGGGGNKRRALGLLVNQFNHNNNNLPPGGRGGGGGGLINKRSSSHPQPLPHHQTHHHTTLQVQVEVQVQVQFQEESKKQKPSVPRPNTFGECIFIDADDTYLPDHDQPVPMLLEQHTEEDSSIIIHDTDHHHPHHTEEIEMEEGSVVDIDEFDAKNPLAVVDYVADIYTYYKKMESLSCVSPDYMAQQTDINEKMRAILIDWLIEVHDKFELVKETLFLTVTLIDRFLSQQPMARKKLQLVGLVAMLLACKYEEVSVPIVGDLIVISDKAYTRKEVLEMEKLMLNKLQFNLSLPTPYVFMTRFLKAAQSDTKLEMLAFYLVELSLVEYEMLHFTPSLLAASAIYTAQCSLYGFKQWTRTCEWHTTYSEHQLLECSRKMVGFHQQAGTGKLTGVYRKYSSSKLGYTSSKCEPAGFLLETQL